MRRFMQWTGAALVIVTAIAACGSDSTTSSNDNVGQSIAKAPANSGEGQTAAVGTKTADSLRVIVKQDGVPAAGVTVFWTAVGTGAAVSPATSQTDGAGLAATQWTLGQQAGPQTATAGLAAGTATQVDFHATAIPAAAANLTKIAGDGQTGIIGGSFPTQVKVSVTDQLGNPITGAQVHFAGTGGITPVNATVLTAANGQAATTVTGAAAAGAGSVIATVTGIATPATFTLTTANAVREVTIGAGILFKSNRNNTTNPAVDTIAAGQGVLWRWAGGTHSVESTGNPTFTSSAVSNTVGNLYVLTFNTAGTYQYDCAVHGAAMTGRVVVQ